MILARLPWLGRPGGCGRREQGQRGRGRAGDVDEGRGAVMEVARLPDGQAADQVGVGGPGPLLPGSALIPPRVADQLVRRFQHAPRARQGDEGFGVGGVEDEDAAVGGGRDSVPLILISPEPCQDCAETCTPIPSDRPRSYRFDSGTRRDTAE
jgi:hypothetical protein